jgi:cytochrome o ubiquinol oxidase operon protein cyoD
MTTHDYFRAIGVLPEEGTVSVRGYLYGLALSLACTLAAFVAVMESGARTGQPIAFVVALALVQYFVQATYFLHVRRSHAEGSDRSLAFAAFSAIVAVLVVGSLWVMSHLDERMMAPVAQMEYMQTH